MVKLNVIITNARILVIIGRHQKNCVKYWLMSGN